MIDSPQSIVYDEAENRLHVQKAILASLLADEPWALIEEALKVHAAPQATGVTV